MTTLEIQVIDASYSIEEDQVDTLAVIELFGRTREGQSVSVRYKDYHPYFYMAKHEKMLQVLKADIKDEIISVETVKHIYEGEKKDFYKITIKTPTLITKLRKRYSKRILLTSADILYPLRFFYDFDLGICIKVTGEIVEHPNDYSTDILIFAEKIEPVEEAFTIPLTYMGFDIECSIAHDTLLVLGAVVKKGDQWIERIFVGDESYIIREFEQFVRQTDPDIITGWNIDNYDIPQLIRRAEANKIEWPMLSRNDHHLRQHSRFWKATGRILADSWWHTKLIKHPKKETLNAVAQQLLGKKKMEIQAKNIDHHWTTEKENVMKYCLLDARLALEILLKVQAVDKGFNLGAIAKLPLSIALENKTSQLIDSLLIREAEHEGYAVPCTKRSDDEDEEKIEGAFVHEIKPGVRKWLIVLDFKAMYPSIIITNNLCFSTYSPKEGTIITPIGAKFLAPSVRLGMLPRIMRSLQMKRDQIKKLMRAYPEQKEFYDGLQNAVKILSNAHYGVFTSDFYRFTNKEIGASITAYGRELTKSIIKQLTDEGFEVVYGDTDSLMVQSPYSNLEETLQFGKELSKRFTFSGYTLEFEKVFESFFSHGAKKRYVGKLAWPEQDIFVRGYEMRRTDAFDLQSETLSEVFNLILADKPREAMNYARGIISEIKKGNVEVSKLVISKTCKEFEGYKRPETMANVQCAQKLIAMGYPFTPGSKVSWIVIDGHTSPAKVEPYLDGVPFKYAPDWEYYSERLATTIGRATEAFGWAADFLISGKEQDTLDSSADIPPSTIKMKEKTKTKTTIYMTKNLESFKDK